MTSPPPGPPGPLDADQFWMAEQAAIVAHIEQSTAELGGAVLTLTAVQNKQIGTLRRAVRWTVVGLLLDLLLTVLGVFLVRATQDNARQIERNQRAIEANQAALRARQAQTGPALCSIYDLLLDSYNPASPSAKADPVNYQQAFAQLESGARVFGCPHATRGRD